ncbi:hypothetical protein Ancab_016698 [Ancistrocladus abbreviatus]
MTSSSSFSDQLQNLYHPLVVFMIGSLLSFAALKFQTHSREMSLFEQHPITMQVAVLSIVLYGLFYCATLGPFPPALLQLLRRFMLFSALMSSASLASLLLLPPFLQLLYAAAILLMILQLFPAQCRMLWTWVNAKAQNILSWFKGWIKKSPGVCDTIPESTPVPPALSDTIHHGFSNSGFWSFPGFESPTGKNG